METKNDEGRSTVGRESAKLAGAFILGLSLGALAVWGYYALTPQGGQVADVLDETMKEAGGSDRDAADNSGRSEESSALPRGGVGAVSPLIVDAQSAGLGVFVRRVIVDESSWVVIYEDRGGQPGNALGAARFERGRTSGEVELLRGTLPGKIYYAVIHRDDGDRIFSLERDFPTRDEEGEPLMVRFMTN